MASFDDYDEFGNYIGADLDSDNEDEPQNRFVQQQNVSGSAAPLEGFDEDERMQEVQDEDAAMEVDGEQGQSCTEALKA
jgi:116 kDa U5 small nuclear ribonucleoprotein component